jgi:hypothetical protein
VNINARDRWGATPLSYALKMSPAIVEFLRTNGASEGSAQGDYQAL